MSFVNLVSGGLDSTLIGVMAQEEHITHFPLFIDYGQRAAAKEWATCQVVHRQRGVGNATLDFATLPNGLYTVHLQSDTRRRALRFVKR